jgi:non-ribosomal peptide synthetase component E (peptide arylation enzyme)
MDPSMKTAPQTIPQVIRQAAARFGTRAAIVDGELTLGYAALVERAETAARATCGSSPARPP